ncbi:hypothetical protein pb186bvf_008744 [Paramecium bursaria]
MGRKKIDIKHIEDKQQRNITFNKRKIGLLRKAAQLSELCNTQIYLVFNDLSGNVITFKTDELDMLDSPKKKSYSLTPKDYPSFRIRKQRKLRQKPKKKEEPLQPKIEDQQPDLKIVTECAGYDDPAPSKYSISNFFFFPQHFMKREGAI